MKQRKRKEPPPTEAEIIYARYVTELMYTGNAEATEETADAFLKCMAPKGVIPPPMPPHVLKELAAGMNEYNSEQARRARRQMG